MGRYPFIISKNVSMALLFVSLVILLVSYFLPPSKVYNPAVIHLSLLTLKLSMGVVAGFCIVFIASLYLLIRVPASIKAIKSDLRKLLMVHILKSGRFLSEGMFSKQAIDNACSEIRLEIMKNYTFIPRIRRQILIELAVALAAFVFIFSNAVTPDIFALVREILHMSATILMPLILFSAISSVVVFVTIWFVLSAIYFFFVQRAYEGRPAILMMITPLLIFALFVMLSLSFLTPEKASILTFGTSMVMSTSIIRFISATYTCPLMSSETRNSSILARLFAGERDSTEEGITIDNIRESICKLSEKYKVTTKYTVSPAVRFFFRPEVVERNSLFRNIRGFIEDFELLVVSGWTFLEKGRDIDELICILRDKPIVFVHLATDQIISIVSSEDRKREFFDILRTLDFSFVALTVIDCERVVYISRKTAGISKELKDALAELIRNVDKMPLVMIFDGMVLDDVRYVLGANDENVVIFDESGEASRRAKWLFFAEKTLPKEKYRENVLGIGLEIVFDHCLKCISCLLYTSPSPRDRG